MCSVPLAYNSKQCKAWHLQAACMCSCPKVHCICIMLQWVAAGSAQHRLPFGAWLSSLSALWRPAPYAYLDDATGNSNRPAASARRHRSDLHVTSATLPMDESSRHEQQLSQRRQQLSTSSTQKQQSGLRQRRSHQNLQAWPSEDEQHAGTSLAQQGEPCSTHHVSVPDNGRWQRLLGSKRPRKYWTPRSKPSVTDAAHRDLLHRVKDVLPHLSDEVIVAELERTLDADQAVDNLLSR